MNMVPICMGEAATFEQQWTTVLIRHLDIKSTFCLDFSCSFLSFILSFLFLGIFNTGCFKWGKKEMWNMFTFFLSFVNTKGGHINISTYFLLVSYIDFRVTMTTV